MSIYDESCIVLATNDMTSITSKLKHIDIKLSSCIRDIVKQFAISITWCPTSYMLADNLTKSSLPSSNLLKYARRMLNGCYF